MDISETIVPPYVPKDDTVSDVLKGVIVQVRNATIFTDAETVTKMILVIIFLLITIISEMAVFQKLTDLVKIDEWNDKGNFILKNQIKGDKWEIAKMLTTICTHIGESSI